VSADTVIYGSLNLDPAVVLAEVLSIASRYDADTGETMRASLKLPQPDGSVLDVGTDVISQFVGPLSGGLMLAKPYDAENVNLLVALRHKSQAAVAKLVALVPPGMLQPTEVLGNTVYELPMVPGAAIGLTERALLPGTKPAVQAFIRSEGKEGRGLSDAPRFKRLAGLVPKRTCALLYVDGIEFFDAQMAIAKASRAEAEEASTPDMSAGASLRAVLGAEYAAAEEEIEDLRTLRKYQTITILSLSTEPEGLRFDAVSMPPASSE